MERVHEHGHVLDLGDFRIERRLARTRGMAELDTVLVGGCLLYTSEMPSFVPLLMMTVWLHASELRPMTRAPVPSIW